MNAPNLTELAFILKRNILQSFCLAAVIICVAAVSASAQESVIWEQGNTPGSSGPADFGPSQNNGPAATVIDSELADDINLTGTINRVEIHGSSSGFTQPTPTSDFYYGLRIRFYAYGSDDKPGALQAEYFISKNSPNFLFQDFGLGDLRVRLETPFQATGRHFITAQVVMDPASALWRWRSFNADPIREQAPYFRNNAGSAWGRSAPNDGSRNLSLRLWGTRVLISPPTISQISRNNVPQAGRVKIVGTGFGNAQGTSFVRINGAAAPVSTWGETSVTAYVSDSSALGAGSLEVVTAGGTSNSKPITVSARPGSFGRVLWRFQADDAYILGRPATGPDGTVYAAGVGGRLYALTPSGGVKWIFRGSFPVVQSVSVGADNTAYFAGGNVVYALNPNGTLKWQAVNSNGASFIAGPNVGPDGNIYAVAGLGADGPQLGAVTISPGGQILQSRPGYVEPRTRVLFNREIVFGSNQFYFGGLNNSIFSTGGLEYFQLGGIYRLTAAAGGHQPAVAPDGTVYATIGGNTGTPERLGAFSPVSGNLLRTLLPTELYLESPDIGADGTIYMTHDLSMISAYNPDGSNLWNFNPGSGINGGAIVNAQNSIVSAGGYEIGGPGFIYGLSNTGQSIWTLELPAENGNYVRPMSRARFSADGQTVYYGTDVNDYANDVYSYLYAISASADLPCSVGIAPEAATYEYNGGSGNIAVAAVNQTCPWTAAANASWITVFTTIGTGNGNVTYTVSANPNFAPRTGTISIGGRPFTVTQGARTTNTRVSITSPAPGDSFTLPGNIFVSANANSAAGSVARVEFFANDQLIGTDTSAPYQIVWNDPSATAYTLVAKSFDQNGTMTLSEAVTITVYPVPPPEPAPLPIPPPTLTSPSAGQVFTSGAAVNFAAEPGASQYPTERVEFYLGTSLVGSDTTSPYNFTLANLPAGIYSVSARTVAVTGALATSLQIDIVVNPNLTRAAARLFDYDGDGKTDISVARPSSAVWYIQNSSGTPPFSFAQFGLGTDAITPADFDGDGKTDVSIFRESNGLWYWQRSIDGAVAGYQFGTPGDKPVPQDYDGDGKADVAIFRPSTGTWWIYRSSDSQAQAIQFGLAEDIPTPGDFDGDGKGDIALYRPSTAVFYRLNSGTGQFYAVQFGSGGDKPTPADFDGDGKTDIAVFKPASGAWYMYNSSNGTVTAAVFGLNGDKPVAGDYDGDGKADQAVFRPSNGTWYMNRSTAGFSAQQFGISEDRPTPNAFVP